MNKKLISLTLLGLLVVSLISYVIADEILQEPTPSEQVVLAIEESQKIENQIITIQEEVLDEQRETERKIDVQKQIAESSKNIPTQRGEQ